MKSRQILKPSLFLACLLPAVWLLFALLTDRLGANPIEAVTHETGQWTLRLLLLTLLMTPLRQRFGWGWPIRVRRMLGLFAFFYASLHLLTYLWLDQFFFWDEILRDIIKRPFITVGMLGFLLLVPLAVTSTNDMMRRLGRNWKRLHRLAYVVPVLGVLHYLWLVKADLREPLVYAVLLVVLLWQRRPAVRDRQVPAVRRGTSGA
nr:protein-methionine-sulfoxide reductase heme-binding subunit MsrQ [Thiohalobacter sp.]